MAKSKIRDALIEIVGLKIVRNEEDVDFRKRLVSAVGELSDDDWNSLSTEQQDWFNDAADAINAKKDPIDFPDLVEDAPTTRTRRGAKEPEPAEPETPTRRGRTEKEVEVSAPVVGDVVIVTNNRDKMYEGELVEIDGDIIVVDVDGSDMEFTRERCKSVVKKESEVAGQADDDAPAYEPALKDVVTIINSRDKEFTGEIVEIDDKIIILDVDGKDVEFNRERCKSVVLAGVTEPAEPEKSTRRGRAEKEEKPETVTEKKKVSAKDNGGISVSQRIKEIIAEDFKATKEDIAKILTKEGLQFRENTLAMNHADAHKFIKILKDAGKLK